MKKIKNILLLSALFLSSCGIGAYEISFGYGNGFKENDRIGVEFKLAMKLESGYELKGTFLSEKEAPLQENTIFSIVDSNPAMSSSYQENILFNFRKSDLKENNDKTHSMDFSVKFTKLEDYFKEGENQTFFFFIHGKEFDIGNIYTYSALDYHYSFDGTKVKLIERQ